MKTKQEIEVLAQSIYPLNIVSVMDGFEDSFRFEREAFELAYTKCQQDMTNKWFEYPKNIPPIHSENYLVILNGSIEISLYRGDHNKFQQELSKDNNITHWMPLPNKPLNKQD